MDSELEVFLLRNGVIAPFQLKSIRSGRNSAVYRVSNQSGCWILKHYFTHQSDTRSRLNSEYQFLTFLNEVDSQSVAKPLGRDEKKQFALYSFIPGIRPVAITDFHIEKASKFILFLHGLKDHPKSGEIQNAAEACFNVEQHLTLVHRRFLQLEALNPSKPEAAELLQWVESVLRPEWLKIQSNVAVSNEKSAHLEITLSPSDFGFHNSLEHQGNLAFIDFEYAGWDSLAKLARDFICQPELPITGIQAVQFIQKLVKGTSNHALIDQVQLLLPIHRIKWCCILVNIFRDIDYQRRSYAGALLNNALIDQLNKAKRYFDTYLKN